MPDSESRLSRERGNTSQQLGFDVPSLESALHSPPEARLDRHLGPGVLFRFGESGASSLEIYSQVVRISLPDEELAIRRREPHVAAEGVIFEHPERFFLSVGPSGDVLF